MQNLSRFRKFLMIGLATALMGVAAPAQAEIFIQRSKEGAQGGTGSAPIFLNRSQPGTQSGSSGVYVPSDQKSVRTMSAEERRARAQDNYKTNTDAESGKAYSIDEYNRRMIAQRQKAANAANGTANRKAGNNNAYEGLARSGYGQAVKDRVVVDPGTGQMMKKSELEALQQKRAEYVKNNPSAAGRSRTPSEESFFAKNGYYAEDADEPADGKGVRNSFGTKLDYTPPTRRDKYGNLAERYRNYSTSGSDR